LTAGGGMESPCLSVEDFPREAFLYHLMAWALEYQLQESRREVLAAIYDAMGLLPGRAGCAGEC